MPVVTAAVLRSTDRGLNVETLERVGPQAGEVLVRMGAAGVCASDHHVIHGTAVLPLPCVLGHEGAGTVEEVGAGVMNLRPGDRVILSFVSNCGHCGQCRSGSPQLCDTNGLTGARHFDGTNVIFADGHAKWLRQEVIHKAAISAVAPTPWLP